VGQWQGAVENVEMNPGFWRNKSVFVTGHTGFKGSWLSLWLSSAGAQVHGYSLPPPTDPSLFAVAGLQDVVTSHIVGDIRDMERLEHAMTAARPDIVLHLAAQPLVRYSYVEPVETYSVNVIGTVNVLEAVRKCSGVRAVINVTTDKCYDNKEWIWAYRESEPLGGNDPYSSSKACSEIITAAYRNSFLQQAGVAIATGRAGNVIGGGDWALDRLLPDFFRAVASGRTLEVRFPESTRPWQHVLEPLSGYLLLAERLWIDAARYATGWNFGPSDDDAWTVRRILDRLTSRIPGTAWRKVDGEHVHEAGYLKLDSSRARAELGWAPRWTLERALDMTIEWHEAWSRDAKMREVCLAQIAAYVQQRA
jgi:CDP-glucose 4,6-dehydratase